MEGLRDDGDLGPGMNIRATLLALALTVPVLKTAEAGGAEPDPSRSPGERAAAIEWYAFAAPFYLPETGLGLGAVAGVHRVLCPGCQPSSVHLEAAYTLRDQFSVTLAPR